MKISTSQELLTLVNEIATIMNFNMKVEVCENPDPEEDTDPAVTFENVTIWLLKRNGKETWCADIAINSYSWSSGPDTDIKDIYSGSSVLLAIQAGMKVVLSERLSLAIESKSMEEFI